MTIRGRRAAAITLSAIVLSGCQSGQVGSDPNDPDQVEVVTWWAAGADQTALYDLVDVFGDQNPGLEFIDASVRDPSGDTARASIAARLEAGNPPDTFQAVAGAGLRDYVADGRLQDLATFYVDNGLDEVFPPDLLETLKIDHVLYSVPSDIHRANVLWSNTAVLEQAGVDPATPPSSLDSWIADLARVRNSGVTYPLALGDASTQLQLFEYVLLADLGSEQYRALWLVGSGWGTGAVEDAIDDYARLLEFSDPAQGARDRGETIDAVVYGTAGYAVMADYAEQSFQGIGYKLGGQYQASPAPGTAGVFDLVADSFTLPVGAAHAEAAAAWLRTVASAEGQQALNVAKGSIPARSDVDDAEFAPYQRTAIASLRADTVVPSLTHGVAADPTWTAAIATAAAEFGRDHRAAKLLGALQAAASAALDSGSP